MSETLNTEHLVAEKVGSRLGAVLHGIDAKKDLTEGQKSF